MAAMELPFFESGATLVAEERWHGLLWSAVPQQVISSSATELVTYVPTGAVATRASNRGMAGTEQLTRDERKLLSLRTREARVAEVPEAPDKLFICRPDRWSRVNLGWDHATGAFRGWYVNFELPARGTPTGLASMDLVLDIWVEPDRSWRWKDREDYVRALDDHLLDPAIRGELDAEVAHVVKEIDDRSGPFADHWLAFEPPNGPHPELPAEFAWGGDAWSLPPGPRLADRS